MKNRGPKIAEISRGGGASARSCRAVVAPNTYMSTTGQQAILAVAIVCCSDSMERMAAMSLVE
jgi:hypothetical protein